MSRLRSLIRILPAAMAPLAFVNCGPKPFIHADYADRKPTTVLVLPPENTVQATEVEEIAYPIIYEKMVNRGYYCIAPELARGIFNANKLEDAARINTLPPQKFREIFGADAILRVRVLEWASKYMVLSSNVTIKFEMTLVDARTGEDLWSLTHEVSKAPGNSGGGIVGALVSAAMHAALTPYEPIAEENARTMLSKLPPGPYGTAKKP
jgi:hypothetical protein